MKPRPVSLHKFPPAARGTGRPDRRPSPPERSAQSASDDPQTPVDRPNLAAFAEEFDRVALAADIQRRALRALIDQTLSGGDFGLWKAEILLAELVAAGLAATTTSATGGQTLTIGDITTPNSSASAYALLRNWTSIAPQFFQPRKIPT